jgi:hypothetical protein
MKIYAFPLNDDCFYGLQHQYIDLENIISVGIIEPLAVNDNFTDVLEMFLIFKIYLKNGNSLQIKYHSGNENTEKDISKAIFNKFNIEKLNLINAWNEL